MGTSSLELSGKATAAAMLLAAEPMVVVGPDVAFKIASQGTLEEVLNHVTIEIICIDRGRHSISARLARSEARCRLGNAGVAVLC